VIYFVMLTWCCASMLPQHQVNIKLRQNVLAYEEEKEEERG